MHFPSFLLLRCVVPSSVGSDAELTAARTHARTSLTAAVGVRARRGAGVVAGRLLDISCYWRRNIFCQSSEIAQRRLRDLVTFSFNFIYQENV